MPCPKVGSLAEFLKPALTSIKKSDRNKINLETLIPECSADVDKAFRKSEPNANRWDYYLCVRKKRHHIPIYFEVHRVDHDAVSLLVRKAEWLRDKISVEHWPMISTVPFLVAGANALPPTSPQARLLAMNKLVVISKGARVADLVGS